MTKDSFYKVSNKMGPPSTTHINTTPNNNTNIRRNLLKIDISTITITSSSNSNRYINKWTSLVAGERWMSSRNPRGNHEVAVEVVGVVGVVSEHNHRIPNNSLIMPTPTLCCPIYSPDLRPILPIWWRRCPQPHPQEGRVTPIPLQLQLITGDHSTWFWARLRFSPRRHFIYLLLIRRWS